jgi:hypothetical protein
MNTEDFNLGIYEHYRGGRYTALMLVQHHDTRQPMVVYVSHEKGSVNCRPLRGWYQENGSLCIDTDGWLDEISSNSYSGPRFRYVGPATS